MTQLLEQAVYAPTNARFKVYTIDEVHMLTGHAFNAMLKTLEEPPAHVKFILATTDPQKIPATVLSRCLQFNLKPIPAPVIADYLGQVLNHEQIVFEPSALLALGQAAAGSMRDALSLTDQAIAFSAQDLSLETVQAMLGNIDSDYLVQLMQGLCTQDAALFLSTADQLHQQGLSFSRALADWAELLSNVALAQRAPELVDPSLGYSAHVGQWAQQISADALQLFYTVAIHSRNELHLAPTEHTGFIMACLRMLTLLPSDEGATATPTAAPTQDKAAQTSASAAASSDSVQAAATTPATTSASAQAPAPTTVTSPESAQPPFAPAQPPFAPEQPPAAPAAAPTPSAPSAETPSGAAAQAAPSAEAPSGVAAQAEKTSMGAAPSAHSVDEVAAAQSVAQATDDDTTKIRQTMAPVRMRGGHNQPTQEQVLRTVDSLEQAAQNPATPIQTRTIHNQVIEQSKEQEKTQLEPSPQLEAQAALKTEEDVERQKKVEAKVEKNIEVEAEEKPEAKVEEKSEAKTGEKRETKAEEKLEAKAEKNIEAKAEEKLEDKAEEKSEAKAEKNIETKTEEKSEARSEEKPEAKSEDKRATKNDVEEQAGEQESFEQRAEMPIQPPIAQSIDQPAPPKPAPPKPTLPKHAASKPVADKIPLAQMDAARWAQLSAQLPLTGWAAQIAKHSEWLQHSDTEVVLKLERHSVDDLQAKTKLNTVLNEYFGMPLRLSIQYGRTGADTARAIEQEKQRVRQQKAEQAVSNDPFIRQLKEQFGARVIKDSILPHSHQSTTVYLFYF